MTARLALGLDFGTEAVRALVLDLDTGQELATKTSAYKSGVMSKRLPWGPPLPSDWALQDPADWIDACELAATAALAVANVDRRAIVGIGVDFTSCTVLPTNATGTPLCQLPEWNHEPHAWPKLWKHHAAQGQADDVNELAARLGVSWLPRYGGRISSEWLIPKAAEIVDEAPTAYDAAHRLIEAGDWFVEQLSGELTRNSCAAGFKAQWNKREGYPAQSWLQQLRPQLSDLFTQRAGGRVVPPGTRVGRIRRDWASRLGVPQSVAVAAAIVDAHAGVLGSGVADPGTLYLAIGTSTCHLLLEPSERIVVGISGVVQDGIIEGAYAYEAGQASVGDMLDWYARLVGKSHEELTAAASLLAPGEAGLLALDWWNGSRTPLVDANLSGVIVGFNLATPPAAVYRGLLEATAFGTRLVVDTFAKAEIDVSRLVVGGGLAANKLLVQIYADVTGLPVAVVASDQPSARGAAVLAAAASSQFPDVRTAAKALTQMPSVSLEPRADAHALYDELYGVYLDLIAAFGEADSPLKRLAQVRGRARVGAVPIRVVPLPRR
jgi:L-ribulokinase